MKKIIWLIIALFLGLLIIIISPKKKEKIVVAEVTHSPFYAPFYVSIENGYFKDEGLDIELMLTPGADKVSAAVLSGDAIIGLAGCESALYVYLNGASDYLVTFAGLTKRDGQFIVGKDKDFKWKDLEGKEVLVGRKGGMPALNFIKALENAGVDKSKVRLNYSVDYAALSGAFISGVGDYVNLFEPNATSLVNERYGTILDSVGKMSIEMPYTTFYAKKSSYDKNEVLFNKFRKAIEKGLQYVYSHNESDIAKVISPQFKESKIEELETYIKNYKDADSWLNNTNISKELFDNMENLLLENNLINKLGSYDKLVVNHE